MGTFGCFEVTIGIHGKERVDYLSWETKGIWRAYEIKVTKGDFRSPAAKSFVGHYNYYVMPHVLWLAVKNEIPSDIGVKTERGVVKPPKRRDLTVLHEVLMTSLMRSLYRDAEEYVAAGMDMETLDNWRLKKERNKNQQTIRRLRHEVKMLRERRDWAANDFLRRDGMVEYWRSRALAAEGKTN